MCLLPFEKTAASMEKPLINATANASSVHQITLSADRF